MPRALWWRLLPLALIAAILATPLIEHAWQLYHTHQALQSAQSTTKPVSARPTRIAGEPNRIVVPAAAIDLPVVPGAPDPQTGIWSVAPTKANYATNTAPANNQQGQTFIYGHNNHHVFEALLGLKTGDEAIVYTSNHHTFVYRYSGSTDMTPDHTDIFQKMKQAKGLVLMTCDGDEFQFRHVMQFALVRAS